MYGLATDVNTHRNEHTHIYAHYNLTSGLLNKNFELFYNPKMTKH